MAAHTEEVEVEVNVEILAHAEALKALIRCARHSGCCDDNDCLHRRAQDTLAALERQGLYLMRRVAV